MILTYYPDTDTLDVSFHSPGRRTHEAHPEAVEAAREGGQEFTRHRENVETETHEAGPSGQTLIHYRKDCLEEMTIQHASRRAPAAWGIKALRREAAQVAATTGRLVENLFGEMSTACDFVDLAQNGFCTRPVAPLQDSLGHRSCASPTVSRLRIHSQNRF